MLKLTAPKSSLAYQIYGRPVNQKRDLSKVSVRNLSEAFKVFLATSGEEASPDGDALWFYTLEHLAGELKHVYHPDQIIQNPKHVRVLEMYNERMNMQIARMFYYTLIICIREARHLHSKDTHKEKVTAQWGDKTFKFLCSIEDSASVAMKMLQTNPPDISLEACVDSMVHVFNKGSWSGGFGGKKWGQVAECLSKFVHGEHTPLLFMDVGYTLCHNNGPIFNKHMLYEMYSGKFEKILDIQRAGYIPQLLMEMPSDFSHLVPKELKAFFDDVAGEFKFDKMYVDWFAVDATSPKHKGHYESQKKEQLAKYGGSPDYEKAKKKEKEKQEAFAKENFEIMPGEFVKVIKPVREDMKVAA